MISVIIPTRNRAKFINKALKSLLNQNLPISDFEVLVINNGSTDNTSEIISIYKNQLYNLREIIISEPGLHNGRHAGMKNAKGNILVFADDDIEAFPTWLSSIYLAFKDPDVAMVGGNNYPLFLKTPPKWLYNMWFCKRNKNYKSIPSLSIIEFNQCSKNISPYLIWGCNFPIRKSVLLASGGFHPDAMPENLIRFRGDGETHVSKYVFENRLKCIFSPGASVYHKVTPERMTIDYFYKRGFNQGISDSFTKLREAGLKLNNQKSNASVLIVKVLMYLKNIIEKIIISSSEKKIKDTELAGYKEGFKFHQNVYYNDIEIREWVHKDNYM